VILVEKLQDEDILVITPQGPLEQSDFETIAKAVDPVVLSKSKVTGLMISMESFPGWRDFAAFRAHVKFVANYHRRIERISVLSNSRFIKFIPGIAGYFVHPEIRSFDLAEKEQALAWLEAGRR